MTVAVPAASKSLRVFVVAAGLFAIWSVALWLYNSLFFRFSQFFAFGPVQVAWTLAAFHVAYVLLALPAALFHRQFGYKLGLLLGLSIFSIGAFLLYLAIVQYSSAIFLSAVLVIGSCGAWLDTSLNPLAFAAGTPQTGVRRLNAAHVFNGMGLFAGFLISTTLLGTNYQLSAGAMAQLSARPYVLVGLGTILLAFFLEQISLPHFAAKGTAKTSKLGADLHAVASDKTFWVAATALCAYCVVLTLLWSANYRYRQEELPGHSLAVFERVWFWFFIGRIAGAVLMHWIEPQRLLRWCAALCMVTITAAAALGGTAGWVFLLSSSILLAIVYPTIFGLALTQHWTRLALVAGALVLAAGIGNALSSLSVSLALESLHLGPRLVILLALPFQAVILVFAQKAAAQPSAKATEVAAKVL